MYMNALMGKVNVPEQELQPLEDQPPHHLILYRLVQIMKHSDLQFDSADRHSRRRDMTQIETKSQIAPVQHINSIWFKKRKEEGLFTGMKMGTLLDIGVTLDIAPFAVRIQTAQGPFWENDIIFEQTSWKTFTSSYSHSTIQFQQSKTHKNMNLSSFHGDDMWGKSNS